MSHLVARAASAAWGLFAAMTLTLSGAAQPLDGLPDFVAPDLPPGSKRLCAGPIAPDLPPGELQAVASASQELPPLPDWCDGTCTIDIAFFWAPETIRQTRADVFGPDTENPDEPHGPQTVGELRTVIQASIEGVNVAFGRAGLDAELRFVGLDRDPGLTGLNYYEAIYHVRLERLAHARQKYGADSFIRLPQQEAIVAAQPSASGG